jgi:acyl-CoA thioesterase
MKNEMLKFTKDDRFAEFVGVKIIQVEVGYALTELTITASHCNGAGVAHGGAIFTLADYAFAVASNAGGEMSLAINVSISYFRAAKEGACLTAEAKEIASSRKLTTCNVDITDQENRLIARFTGTGYKKTTGNNHAATK